MAGKPLPSYDTLWINYPDYMTYPDSDEVKELIGGDVNAGWITNTCAVRMSRALNGSGILVPNGFKGLLTVAGADRRRYALRVREMRVWFASTLVTPDFDLRKNAHAAFDKSAIADMKGLIAFDIAFADATGHLDLWNGDNMTAESQMSKDYYQAATRITLWKTA
jgi:hypothetical protein